MNSDYSTFFNEPQQSSSEGFDEEASRIASISKKKNYCGLQDDSRKKSKKKHWKPHENKKYVDFLRNHMELFEKNREDKRLMKINILMSNHVKSKNSTQCRSHHQKMLAHYKTIENIILCLCADSQQEELKVDAKSQPESVPVDLEEDLIEEIEESSQEATG
jgi:hypothetical protein